MHRSLHPGLADLDSPITHWVPGSCLPHPWIACADWSTLAYVKVGSLIPYSLREVWVPKAVKVGCSRFLVVLPIRDPTSTDFATQPSLRQVLTKQILGFDIWAFFENTDPGCNASISCVCYLVLSKFTHWMLTISICILSKCMTASDSTIWIHENKRQHWLTIRIDILWVARHNNPWLYLSLTLSVLSYHLTKATIQMLLHKPTMCWINWTSNQTPEVMLKSLLWW